LSIIDLEVKGTARNTKEVIKMKLEIVSGQCSFLGKTKERNKIEKALGLMFAEIGDSHAPMTFDNSEDSCDYCDIGFAYDEYWTVNDIRRIWRKIKKGSF
tara:strand:- start:246 stop:545 length:300 start_codon:yes stop_codon:yes gene_type:complete